MAAQVVHPSAAVRIEEPLEPFLKEAGEIAFEFLSLRPQPTEAVVGTKAPHPVKDAKGEPGLLRADAEFLAGAEPAAPELPDSLPLIGDGGRRQAQGFAATASGLPPSPSTSRMIAERLITISDSVEKDINDELRKELQKLVVLNKITAFSVNLELFVDVCRRVMQKFSQKFQTGWQQITFVYDAMIILVEIVRREAGGYSTSITEQLIKNFIGQALTELGLYQWLIHHGGWENFGTTPHVEADRKVNFDGLPDEYTTVVVLGERERASSNPRVVQESEVLAKQSPYYSLAQKQAQVPFLDHQLLECDCNGAEYTNVDHDITLRIPEGALAKGEKIHFEIGVAMYGPFIFPDNTQPISPIVWLCILEEGVELKKPFQVVLPHYLTGLSKERIQYHQVSFAKASHNDYNNQMYEFQKMETIPLVLASSGNKSYGVLVSKHCCFYCLEAGRSPDLALDAGYCLTRIESSGSPSRSKVYFAATYFLDTCLRSLENQFPPENYYCVHHEFKFKDDTEPLKLIVPDKHDQCIIALEPAHGKIKPSAIDFWTNDPKAAQKMQWRHKQRMYPPRVEMTISLKKSDVTFKLPIKFTGHNCDDDLDMELILPLGPTLSGPLPVPTISANPILDTTPTLTKLTVLKSASGQKTQIIKRMAAHWRDLGILLDFDTSGNELDIIKKKHQGDPEECCQAMFQHWVKGNGKKPHTWRTLIELIHDSDQKVLGQEIENALVHVAGSCDIRI